MGIKHQDEQIRSWKLVGPAPKDGKNACWYVQCQDCLRKSITTTTRWNARNLKRCECQQEVRTRAKKEAKPKRNLVYLTHNGISRTIPEWADHLNVPTSTIYSRLYRRSEYVSDEAVLFGRDSDHHLAKVVPDFPEEIDRTKQIMLRVIEKELMPKIQLEVENFISVRIQPLLMRLYEQSGRPAFSTATDRLIPADPVPEATSTFVPLTGPKDPRWRELFLQDTTCEEAYWAYMAGLDNANQTPCKDPVEILAQMNAWASGRGLPDATMSFKDFFWGYGAEKPDNLEELAKEAMVKPIEVFNPKPKTTPEPPPRKIPCPQNSSVLPEFFEYRQVDLDLDKMPDWWASEEQADPEALNRFLHLPWIEGNPLIYKIDHPLKQFPWYYPAPALLPRPFIRYAACAWDRGVLLQKHQDYPEIVRYVQSQDLSSIQDVNEFYSFVYLANGLYNWGGQTFLWNHHPERDTPDILYAICEEISRWYTAEHGHWQQLACHAAYLLNRQCIYLDHWKRTRDFSFQKNLVRNKDFILGEGFVSCVMTYLPNLQELIGEMDANHFVDNKGKRVVLFDHWDPMTQKN